MSHHSRDRGRRMVLGFGLLLIPLAACGPRGAADYYTGFAAGPSSPATWGGEHTFGSIDGFALVDSGVAVVSDATNGHLDLFVDGKDVRTFGRLGTAAGDFTSFGAVAALPADTFVVLDPNRARLVAFRRVADSVVRLGPIDLPFRVTGVCSAADRLFVLGRYDSTLVQEVTTAGAVRRSFGTLEGEGPFQIRMNAAAEIACSSESDRVAVASRVPGELRIFTTDGQRVLRDSIPEFVHSIYRRAGMGARALQTTRGWNLVEDLHWFGKDLLVQLGQSPEAREKMFESRWLSGTGAWRNGVRSWPRVLGHDSEGRVYVVAMAPHPTVKVYKVRR